MTNATARRAGPGPEDAHDAITQWALTELETGGFPWIVDWASARARVGLPHDPLSARSYDGLATLTLWHAAVRKGYPTQSWSTRQLLDRIGAQIRRGERGTTIFVSPVWPKSALSRRAGLGPHWRYLDLLVPVTVYNLAQCSRLPDEMTAAIRLDRRNDDSAYHELVAATGIDFRLGAFRSFYDLSEDEIALCDWRDRDLAGFQRDCLHELIHATGHPARLDRAMPEVFGSTVHGFEDLVAEMGGAFLCASLGIEPAPRHSEGRAQWIALLRADSRAFARAATSGAAAAAYVFALRDAQAAAFDRLEAEEAAAERDVIAGSRAARRWKRQQERERWASGRVTGLRPRESLPAARPGDPAWQSLSSSSS